MKRIYILIFILLSLNIILSSQEYLHTEGKYIYSGTGEEVILRGIGTGNWMLQEGYMMQSSDVANTQHEFREKLIEEIGTENTDSFYTAWLTYHFTRTDVDSMKAWGFNSVRVAMHYKWFTLPTEEEPVPGQNTWIDTGFNLIDSLLDWCSDKEMYLILDMHGAPGGQGEDAAISDYDPSKPSLWESQENKDKLIALWKKLADRYSDEPWIGGYDLINEPNWSLGGSNAVLWQLYQDITDTIREVDTNHMIIIEGNWFANDYTGITAPWDDNLVYSFHKYGTFNTLSSIQWMIDLRNTRNVPVWLGETGENSNTWFTNVIKLCEDHHIGWSFWPVKKAGINNVLQVSVNEDYRQLIDSWSGQAASLSPEEAFQAVLGFAENHKFENCSIKKDVIDAMTRQLYSDETLPFSLHQPGQPVYATDYDLGRNNIAYFDQDTANYEYDQNNHYTSWNQGWSYRNDGVDIEACTDSEQTNGFNVGWTAKGEWLQYTFLTDSSAAYTLTVRYASGSTGGKIRFESNGIPVTGNISLSGTGNWQNWNSVQIDNVVLPAGEQKLKLHIVQEGININYFEFSDPVPICSVPFEAVHAFTSEDGSIIYLACNQEIVTPVNELNIGDFSLQINGSNLPIASLEINTSFKQVLLINLAEEIHFGESITINYTGSGIASACGPLEDFEGLSVQNVLPLRHEIPCRIEAEAFETNNGFSLEICEDTGGGYNTAYANAGDYLDYPVYVPKAGAYTVGYRVATQRSNAVIVLLADIEGILTSLDTMHFSSTGDWQTWQTQQGSANLPEGRYTLRILVMQSEYNLNWFEFKEVDALGDGCNPETIEIFPNPAEGEFWVQVPNSLPGSAKLSVFDLAGNLYWKETVPYELFRVPVQNWQAGIYLVIIDDNTGILYTKPVILR